ncbi:response regulator transcription factor [Mangrovibacillus cuniculi]|uniref:Response regulator n=1 Tax=Mangrovibacillus cuniculi TaxID=2593652 RepID=A0A7S8C9Q8_9BACI|nr:response regulator [Mangrovibacillus cuniculi]QPC45808.1 response regulator [Mangrovibacillus cuniculi]
MKAIIIDDEKHVREGLLLLGEWEENGIHSILEAENGEEGIQLIQQQKPDLIFTDMQMPIKDGISVLEWLHSSAYHGKTIVVSGYDDYHYMRTAINYQSFDYILKPIDPALLNETLRKAVELLRENEPPPNVVDSEITKYVEEHFREEINLQDIANTFFMSREHISRKFKQEHNLTITEYITKKRLEESKKLLKKPQLKIYEVAYQVGYQNDKYFSKVFKKYYGITPNDYREGLEKG